MKRIVRAGLAAIAVAGVLAGTAEARTNRALLIGVADYPNLPKAEWLEGPGHDAALVKEFLLSNGTAPFRADDVVLLATGLDAKSMPTRAAILDAMASLARDAESGDFVYIQFSGHGAQQPALVAGQEQDGLDEVFLPADTMPSPDGKAGMPNVILDDEIGSALDAIRDKGAFVWIVFDACHSGTATRALGTGSPERQRKLSPAATGLAPEALATVEKSRSAGDREHALELDGEAGRPSGARGGMVAFFAAQTVETAPELPLPENDADARMYGLFTHTLISKLAVNPTATYRQLSQSILQHYSSINRTKPTPLFEGDLDAPVFGTQAGDGVLQWKLTVGDAGISLPAGKLHRVVPGTKLAILPTPLSSLEEAVGYLDVRSATSLTSRLLPAEHEGRRALTIGEIPAGAYARVTEFEVDFELAVARPPPAPGLDAGVAAANAVLDAIVADGKAPLKLRIVAPDQPADLRLAVLRARDVEGAGATEPSDPALWLLPPSGEITLAPGKRPTSRSLAAEGAGLQKTLRDDLVRISRAMNLSRLAGASDFRPSEVSVSFLIERSGREGEFEEIEAGTVPFLRTGDSIYVKAANTSRRAVDLNVLYVGSDYTIYAATQPIRLQEDDELPETGLFTVSDSTFGNERLIAVLTEALPQTPTLDLGYLAQTGVRQKSRSSGRPDGFAGMLNDIATAPAARDVKQFKDKRGTKGAVLVFPVETAPVE